jgi:sulfur carrier protein
MIVYVNGEPREVHQAITLAELVRAGGAAAPRGVAVAVDGTVVPRARHTETTLHQGARVEIVTAVQGG